MNGVYLRALPRRRVRATCSSLYLARAGLRLGRAARSARRRRSCRRRSRSSASSPRSRASSSTTSRRRRSTATAPCVAAARDALAELEPFTAESIEAALRAVLERARAEAAAGLPADPHRGHRLEDLARALREHRAARARDDARAAQRAPLHRQRLRRCQRVERPLELPATPAAGTASTAAGRSSSLRFVSPRPTSAPRVARVLFSSLRSKRRRRAARGYGRSSDSCRRGDGGDEAGRARRRRRAGDPAALQGESRARAATRCARPARSTRPARAIDGEPSTSSCSTCTSATSAARRCSRSCGERQIPVAVVTGSAELEPVSGTGADAVLGKPFTIEELEATVARLAGRRTA